MTSTSALFAQKLSDFKWKNRIIILSDIDPDFSNAKIALEIISKYKDALKERDILIFLHTQDQLYTTNLNVTDIEIKKLDIKDLNGYLLIGKDGGTKVQKPYPIIPEEIFKLIDGMPMRRAEIKANK